MTISGIKYSHNFLILQKIAQATKNPDIPTTNVLNNLISFKNSTKCLNLDSILKSSAKGVGIFHEGLLLANSYSLTPPANYRM